MTNDSNPLPEAAGPQPPEVEAEPIGTALQVQESAPAEPPPKPAGRSPGLVLLAIFAAVSVIAALAYFMRSRTADPPAASTAPEAPAAVSIELPSAAAPAPDGLHGAPAVGGAPANPSPEKIFNDASSFKETAGAADQAASEGYINELPPAPHATPGGGDNNALINAAKRALEDDGADAPEAPEPEAGLAPYDAQALAALEADARRALAFSALAAKARSGAPYTEELKAFLAEAQDKPLPGFIADRAPAGTPTAAALAAGFAEVHDDALAAGRRAEASGPVAKIGASFASFINLRPSGPAKGVSTAAVLSRVEAAALSGDLEGALAEAAALRPEAAAALAPWLRDAEARVALEAALQEREGALHARLAGGGSR